MRYSSDKIFKLKVTTAWSKVKSRSHYEAAHLNPQPMSQLCINFTSYGFLRYSAEKTFLVAHPPIWTPWVKTLYPDSPYGLWVKIVYTFQTV